MASTVSNGNDLSEKWQRPFNEREIGRADTTGVCIKKIILEILDV